MYKEFKPVLESIHSEVIENVVKDENNYFKDNLKGFCANMSYLVWCSLNALGYDCYIAGNNKHCFVIYDEIIIDLTATQFIGNFSRIEFLPRTNSGNWSEDFLTEDNSKIYDCLKEWPPEQTPFYFMEQNEWYNQKIKEALMFSEII